MVRPSAKAWLVAILSFATGTLGDASANYTEQLLSSGTGELQGRGLQVIVPLY